MPPMTEEEFAAWEKKACELLLPKGFFYEGKGKFVLNDVVYDLTAADLSRIDYIVENDLCVVGTYVDDNPEFYY